ncbi:MAG: RHS repeat-associated core domain-containing protein, partial [Phycisphaerales bacterium]
MLHPHEIDTHQVLDATTARLSSPQRHSSIPRLRSFFSVQPPFILARGSFLKCPRPARFRGHLSFIAAITVALFSFLRAAAAAEPIVLMDDALLRLGVGPGEGAATRVQGATLSALQRSTFPDGSGTRFGAFGWSSAGNPAEGSGSRRFGVVDLATGAVELSRVDILLPAHVPWPVARSYSSARLESTLGYQGWGWFHCAQPELLFDDAHGRIIIVAGADRFIEFKSVAGTSGEYRGINGAAGALLIRTLSGVEVVEYLDQVGTRTTFFGRTTGSHAHAAGQLWRVEDAGGHVAHVGQPSTTSPNPARDDPAEASAAFDSDGRVTSAFDSAGRSFEYTYAGTGSATRLTKVTARATGLLTSDTVAEARYTYTSGGDLESAQSLLPVSTSARSEHAVETYHYFDASGQHAHHLRILLDAEATRRYELTGGPIGWSGPTITAPRAAAADPANLRGWATVEIASYDTVGRATRIGGDGNAVRTIGGTQQWVGWYDLTYASSSWGTSYSPLPAIRTTIKQPPRDSAECETAGTSAAHTFVVVDFDIAGQPLSTVTTDGDPAAPGGLTSWSASTFERDAGGRITAAHAPANVASFDPAAAFGTNPFTYHETEGLVTLFERVNAAASPSLAPVDGFVSGVRLAKGDGAAARSASTYSSFITYQWLTGTIPAIGSAAAGTVPVRRPFVDRSRTYPEETTDPDAPSAAEWETVLTTFSPTSPPAPSAPELIPLSIELHEPVIPIAENGSGGRYSTRTYFNPDGTTRFTLSQRGRVVFLDYDALTGLPTIQVFDAQMEGESSFVTGPTYGITNPAPFGGSPTPLNLRTTWAYDPQGRVTSELTTAGFTRHWLTGVFSDQRTWGLSVPWSAGTGEQALYGGAPTYTVANASGGIEVSARLRCGPERSFLSGPSATPTRIPSIATPPLSWIDSDATDPLSAIVDRSVLGTPVIALSTVQFTFDGAHAMSARTYHAIPSTLPGTPTTDYLQSTICRDALHRVRRIEDAQGNLSELDLDYRGLVTETRAGVVNGPAPMPVARAEYNANGQLVRRRTLPNGPATDSAGERIVDIPRDHRGRPRAIIPPLPPYVAVEFDNRGDVTALALFGGDREGFMGEIPAPSESDERLTLRQFHHDPMGREYRTDDVPINGTTGLPSSNPHDGVTTDTWYGAHGKVVMSAGESVEKYSYDRACNHCATYTIAGTTTVAGSAAAYSESLSVQSTDLVLEQHHRIFTPGFTGLAGTTWHVSAFAAPNIAGIEVPGGLLMKVDPPLEAGGPPRWSNPAGGDGLPPGTILWAREVRPDELGLPALHSDWGDGGQGEDIEPICAGGDCDPPLSINDHPAHRDTENFPNWQLVPSGIIDPPPGSFNLGTRPGWSSGLPDDAILWAREIKYESGRVEQQETTIDGLPDRLQEYHLPPDPEEPVDPCAGPGMTDQTIYDAKRRPKWRQVTEGESPPARAYRWYYGDETETDWGTGIPANLQTLRSNSRPVGFGKPDGVTVFNRTNALGEVIEAATHKLGIDGLAGPFDLPLFDYDITRDLAGRPTASVPGIPSGSPYLGRVPGFETEYDDLGRVRRLRQYDGGSLTDPALASSEELFDFDIYGLPSHLSSRRSGLPGALPGLPLGDQDGSLLDSHLVYAGEHPSMASGGALRRGWQGPRRTLASYPGTDSESALRYKYDPDPALDHTLPAGDPERDYLTGRVNRLHRNLDLGWDLGRYGYMGLGTPAWMEFDAAPSGGGGTRQTLQRPMRLPAHAPTDTGSIHRLVNRFGQPIEDLWQRGSEPQETPEPGSWPVTHEGVAGGVGQEVLHHDRLAYDRAGRLTRVLDDALTWRGGDPEQPFASNGPWGFDQSILYDCRDRIIYAGTGREPAGGGAMRSGPGASNGHSNTGGLQAPPEVARGGPPAAPAPPATHGRREQRWAYDAVGNIKKFVDRTQTAVSYGSIPDHHRRFESAHDDADKVTGRTEHDVSSRPYTDAALTEGTALGSPLVIQSDPLGNVAYDGRWHYDYDALGRLTHAFRPSPTDPNIRGSLFARFTYNAMGQRLSAGYDIDPGATSSTTGYVEGYPAGDGDLANNPREIFAYDERWQLVAVFNQGPVETGTGARPPPVLHERYVHVQMGLRGLSLSMGLDRVVKRERFHAPDSTGHQALKDEVFYLQNRRGDVTELVDEEGKIIERVRYSAYGEPEVIDRRFDLIDFNNDGVISPDDLDDFVTWYFGYNSATDLYHILGDINGDGFIDPGDLDEYITEFFGWDPNYARALPTLPSDHGALSRPEVDNRLGYAGYVWDKWLQVYHVRHRVYEPYHARWHQPDPIGFAGGRNWFEYCGGRPGDSTDPMGMYGIGGALYDLGHWGMGFIRNIGNYSGGVFSDDVVNTDLPPDPAVLAAVQGQLATGATTTTYDESAHLYEKRAGLMKGAVVAAPLTVASGYVVTMMTAGQLGMVGPEDAAFFAAKVLTKGVRGVKRVAGGKWVKVMEDGAEVAIEDAQAIAKLEAELAKNGKRVENAVVGGKPKLVKNPKHHRNAKGKVSPAPRNQEELYENAVPDEDGDYWALGSDGRTYHRFSVNNNGEAHWSGCSCG